MSLSNLPTLAEVERSRRGKALAKGPTRLERAMDARKFTKADEQKFRDTVWHRDKGQCRCCGRKVLKMMGRVENRGEVHHIHGRLGDLRCEPRAALLLCLACHERVTGRVNESRVKLIGTKTFNKGAYTDARYPVVFKGGD
jgi:5-methylcytosine-specific restriction endonuclease McrA